MSEMSLEESQLFRILGGFFGRDRVIWNMSVRAVCGGSFPAGIYSDSERAQAQLSACLFTIVDDDDTPKMVVEFAADFGGAIDLAILERQSRLPQLLESAGIRYIAISAMEFDELVAPGGNSAALLKLLEDRLGLSQDEDGAGD